MEQSVWQEIEQLYQKFQELGINEAVDYDKYYLYSLITHSTAIEGSTLTELDTQLLFDEGVTAKGKPLVHHLMNEDLKQAYELAKAESVSLVPVTPAFLQRLNATLMRTTGSVHSVTGGSHPWVGGNGRTARLLMNYIQFCYHLFPTKIFKEDKEEYILSLRQCQNEETNHPFLDFMAWQLKKSLALEIERFNASRKEGFNFMF